MVRANGNNVDNDFPPPSSSGGGNHPLLNDTGQQQQQQPHRPPGRSMHMRQGSTGSVRGAFYSSQDEYAPRAKAPTHPHHHPSSNASPNKQHRQHHNRRRSPNKVKSSEKMDKVGKVKGGISYQKQQKQQQQQKFQQETSEHSIRGDAFLADESGSSNRGERFTMPARGASLNVSDWSVPQGGELAGMSLLASPTSPAGQRLVQVRGAGSTSNKNQNINSRNVPFGAADYGTTDSYEIPDLMPPSLSHQNQDIAAFAAMAIGDLDDDDKMGSNLQYKAQTHPLMGGPPPSQLVQHPLLMGASPAAHPSGQPPLQIYQKHPLSPSREESEEESDSSDDDDSSYWSGEEEDYSTDDDEAANKNMYQKLLNMCDPTNWLLSDADEDENGNLYFDPNSHKYTVARLVRYFLFNPIAPEFTSLQQFCWAVIIGILMGIYTAFWKYVIETGVDFVWETVPEFLLKLGVFTELEGSFPLYHYMWICPATFGGILSYIFAALPFKIPDQNEWINSVHTKGVQESSTFFVLFVLTTLGMLSGLSLGPELPLVLTAGMVGSWFGILCRQSMLQARVLNLTAASAAIGGFFGFPMAGALFVLELPHRMGLQYFEALSPATISSIVAVLCNRMIVNNDVTGYFKYPFLTSTLPSEIFTNAIVYGLYGAAIGILYAWSCLKLKDFVHDLFHAPHHHDDHGHNEGEEEVAADSGHFDESIPLVTKKHKKKPLVPKPTLAEKMKAFGCIFIKEEPKRAALAGTVAGALVGIISIFVPHVLFWGEAQLQNLIDKGRTPLPVFGEEDEPTAALTALGYCMIDPNDPVAIKEGFSVGCALLIVVSKILVIGLSLGTGIIGGHFWGPLFVGCAASHLLTDVCHWLEDNFGIGGSLGMYPCVVILCTMGSAHVVTFRAHMAIMLILTLTISAFDPENDVNSPFSVAGDYSAVFPLLVVSVFISLMASRGFVFYKTQRCRGDITAVPEVLCQPGMEGSPMVMEYQNRSDDNHSDEFGPSDEFDSDYANMANGPAVRTLKETITQKDIELAFDQQNTATPLVAHRAFSQTSSEAGVPPKDIFDPKDFFASVEPVPGTSQPLSSNRLDFLLSRPLDDAPGKKHRRTQSALPRMERRLGEQYPESKSLPSPQFNRPRTNSNGSVQSANLVRVTSFGEIQETQPSLLDQARSRSASTSADHFTAHRRMNSIGSDSRSHRRLPSLPSGRHSRTASIDSRSLGNDSMNGVLEVDDFSDHFNQAVNKQARDSNSNINSFTQNMWTQNSS